MFNGISSFGQTCGDSGSANMGAAQSTSISNELGNVTPGVSWWKFGVL